jgi:hypothetical protein
MDKRLQNKLKAYSALSAVATLVASSADAQIAHTTVNYTGGYETYDIDVDGNGSVDFTIDAGSSVVTYSAYRIDIRTVGVSGVGNNRAIGVYGSYFNSISALDSSYVVSRYNSFVNVGALAGIVDVEVEIFPGFFYPVFTTSFGQFGDGTTKFVGVEFEISGETHYGWLRFSNIAQDGNSWTLVDMAYDQTPNVCVTTGDISSIFAESPTLSSPSGNLSCPVNATLSVDSGNLNGADTWSWYEESTSGTNVGTGTSINVSPSKTTTYVVVGEKCGVIYGAEQTITVNVEVDNTAPVADASSLSVVEASCDVNSITPPTATDNCAGSITGTTSTVFPVESSTTITWSFDDGNGNISTQTQDVIITPIDKTVSFSNNTLSSNEATSGASYQWIDCDNSNSPIAGEVNKDFSPTVSGTFAVEVSLNGCTTVSDCIQVMLVSTSMISSETVKIFPNPASDMVTISNIGSDTSEIYVEDALGRRVKSLNINSDNAQINISDLDKGIYLIKLIRNSQTKVFKIIKL